MNEKEKEKLTAYVKYSRAMAIKTKKLEGNTKYSMAIIQRVIRDVQENTKAEQLKPETKMLLNIPKNSKRHPG